MNTKSINYFTETDKSDEFKILIDYNPNFTGKVSHDDQMKLNNSFETHRITLPELDEVIKKGFPYTPAHLKRSPKHTGESKRKIWSPKTAINFIEEWIITLDDDSATDKVVDFWMNDKFTQDFGYAVVDSSSSTDEKQKVHILFVVERPFMSEEEVKLVRKAFFHRYSALDKLPSGMRTSYNAPNASYRKIGKILPRHVLEEVVVKPYLKSIEPEKEVVEISDDLTKFVFGQWKYRLSSFAKRTEGRHTALVGLGVYHHSLKISDWAAGVIDAIGDPMPSVIAASKKNGHFKDLAKGSEAEVARVFNDGENHINCEPLDPPEMEELIKPNSYVKVKDADLKGEVYTFQKNGEWLYAIKGRPKSETYSEHELEITPRPSLKPEQKVDAGLLQFSVDHDGHAKATAADYQDLFAFNRQHGWLYYNGKHWQTDADLKVERAISDTLIKRKWLFIQIDKKDEAKKCTVQHGTVVGIREQMKSLPEIYRDHEDFDRVPHLINVNNGVVDLRDGSISEHEADDCFTYCLEVNYRPDRQHNLKAWTDFLKATELADDVVDYLRRALGYSMTGYTSEEVLFYLYGKPRAGKGVIMETVGKVLGSMYRGVEMSMFASTRSNAAADFAIAMLSGVRMVTAGESEQNGRLNAAIIKKATGGDPFHVAKKGKDPFTLKPVWKIWLASNFMAATSANDPAAWGRLRVIEFKKSFFGREDRGLKRRLGGKKSLDAIFAWMVSGAVDWYADRDNGLKTPESITLITEEHRAQTDTIQLFINENCTTHTISNGRGQDTVGSDLYNAYKEWTINGGDQPLYRKSFTTHMKSKGFDVVQHKVKGQPTQRYYQGITLNGRI